MSNPERTHLCASLCASCNAGFAVTPEDMTFYGKLFLPPPTRCPDCRARRRMSWRNDRSFYSRKSSLSGAAMISIYPPDAPFPVYSPAEWYGDGWDPMELGKEIDFSRPFFPQWHELMLTVPRLGIDIVNCENSDYCNYCGDDRNCYLDIAGEANEECFYNLFTKYSKNCVDCTFVYNSEWCYECISCYRCYNVRWSMYVESSHDCLFSFDLKGCKHCLFCSNLRQREYCIANEHYSKAEFERVVKELELGTAEGVRKAHERWIHTVIPSAAHRDMYSLNSEECTGNDIKNSKGCTHVFNIGGCEDCKYLYDVLEAKSCYDLNYSLYHPECSCELISTLGLKFSACSMATHYCDNVFYCDLCNHSSRLFGCIGLTHKENCILNRQYSREEYARLRERLIDHMRETGEWGEFFPEELSPFSYNETVAQEYCPVSRSEATRAGLRWREPSAGSHHAGASLCEVSGQPYKIIQPEQEYYRRQGIPLPLRAPDQRHRDRLSLRNLRKLWRRPCNGCKREMSTSYDPDCRYGIYCTECYQETVSRRG